MIDVNEFLEYYVANLGRSRIKRKDFYEKYKDWITSKNEEVITNKHEFYVYVRDNDLVEETKYDGHFYFRNIKTYAERQQETGREVFLEAMPLKTMLDNFNYEKGQELSIPEYRKYLAKKGYETYYRAGIEYVRDTEKSDWQKCPMCKGEGKINESLCTVCNGYQIINKFTGRSPERN